MLLQCLDHSCPLREQLALLVDPAGQHFVTVVVVKSSTKMYDNERMFQNVEQKRQRRAQGEGSSAPSPPPHLARTPLMETMRTWFVQ